MDHILRASKKKSLERGSRSQTKSAKPLHSSSKEPDSLDLTQKQTRLGIPSTELRRVNSTPSEKKVTFKESPTRKTHQPRRRRSLSPPDNSSLSRNVLASNSLDAEQYISMSDLNQSLIPRPPIDKHRKSENKFKPSNSTRPHLGEEDSNRHLQDVSEPSDAIISRDPQQTKGKASNSPNLMLEMKVKSREDGDQDKGRLEVRARDKPELEGTLDQAYMKDLQDNALSNLYRLKHYNDTTISWPKQHFEAAISNLKAVFDDFNASSTNG